MSNLLVINSSAAGEASVSRALVTQLAAALAAQAPDAAIVERDLAAQPLPHLGADTLAGFGAPQTPAQTEARRLSDELVDELRSADTIVIGAPMYNFGITSTLKAWFDHVLRAGVTFRYSEAGPEGLLAGRRAFVVLSRGGIYSQGPAQVMDAQEPHLRALLAFVGITDVTFIRAEGLAYGDEPRAKAIAEAQAVVAALARPALDKAA